MHVENLHGWDVDISQAIEIQRELAQRVIRHDGLLSPRLIAGIDVSVGRTGDAASVAVVLNYPELKVLETATAYGKTTFPYIPGLLSFREIPLTLQALQKINLTPDLILVDGQGIAHPRHIGLASHLGLFLNLPTIGCAKSPLYGKFESPGNSFGDSSNILDKDGEVIGSVVRTRDGVKPLYISIGHKIDLTSAVQWVLRCCRGYRLPEPSRQAHLVSKSNMLEYLKKE